ncbi:MAG TPA: DNA-3-methyladenine glycosylase I [Thermoplasmata archaeon]|nr:DNA-3-methyladenine glycosylase I [Thermoplasmata archaeon]
MAERAARRANRCAWAANDPLLGSYHDEEWGVPEADGRRLWEKLMLDGFQAGLTWRLVLQRREALRRAFRGFDPVRVARFGTPEIARLLSDPTIIRSRAKITSTIRGARAYLDLEAAGTRFGPFVWDLVGGVPSQSRGPIPAQTPLSSRISDALKSKGFSFVGPTIVYAWMQANGMVNDHAANCFRRSAVARMARGFSAV